ncbi:MAG TPA: zinc ribbon domain-containing protein, partial [Acidimicrobiia bacterium]|nr:zinc ribbon domain-containing protein [Acidimicrobiia bacterium]
MASCMRCGGELPATARFCPTCGRPVEPEVGPPAPPITPSAWSGLQLPAWVTGDWPLVAAGAAVLLGAVFAVSLIVGAVAAVAVSGNADAVPCGAGVGAHLAFAAFGARTVAACRSTTGTALAVSFLPLFWAFVGGLATEVAMRFAWPRLADDRRRRIAYAAKLAVTTGIALGVI